MTKLLKSPEIIGSLLGFFITLIPVFYEVINDKFGESKKDKVKDALWLLIAAVVIMALFWWLFDINPLKIGAMILGWRILVFDYLMNIFLKEFSESHENINWFTYMGTTAFTDRLISKINPWIRLAVRVVLFLLSAWWFFV